MDKVVHSKSHFLHFAAYCTIPQPKGVGSSNFAEKYDGKEYLYLQHNDPFLCAFLLIYLFVYLFVNKKRNESQICIANENVGPDKMY